MSSKQLPKIFNEMTSSVKFALATGFIISLLFLIISVREGHGMPSSPWLNNIVVSHIVEQRDKAKARIEIMMINLFKPSSFIPFVRFIGHPKNSPKAFLSSLLYYYERIIEFAPERAEAHGILGYNYYHLDKHKKATVFYLEAMRLNPNFFWFPYNLGIIHYKNGDYTQAADLFKTAMHIKPEYTLKSIYLSKIYSQIRDAENFHFNLEKRLQLAYQKCYALLALSYHHAGNPSFSTKDDLEKFFQKGNITALPKQDELNVELF